MASGTVPLLESRPVAAPLSLHVRGVSKAFETRRGVLEALDQVSFEIRRGDFVSLIGPTGCGKSTLLRIIGGLTKADVGEVSIFGESPEGATDSKHIGFVPQTPALLPWRSVLDNVRLPFQVNRRGPVGSDRLRDPSQVLESFGLGALLGHKPWQLSLGMQQKVSIARALVFEPSVLLMDEPFSALDELTREQQRHELLRVWQSERKTVLFVTHSVEEAVALSDVVIVMTASPGRVRAVVEVDLPRPRGDAVEYSDEFRRVTARVRRELREGSVG